MDPLKMQQVMGAIASEMRLTPIPSTICIALLTNAMSRELAILLHPSGVAPDVRLLPTERDLHLQFQGQDSMKISWILSMQLRFQDQPQFNIQQIFTDDPGSLKKPLSWLFKSILDSYVPVGLTVQCGDCCTVTQGGEVALIVRRICQMEDFRLAMMDQEKKRVMMTAGAGVPAHPGGI